MTEEKAAAVAHQSVYGNRKRWRHTDGRGFLDRLLVSPQPDGRTWVTQARFRWRDDAGTVYAVPRLFITDFASVPVVLPTLASLVFTGLAGLLVGGWWLWLAGAAIGAGIGLAGFLPYGKHQWAAVIHDYLYYSRAVPRATADRIFFCAMADTGTLFLKRWLMYMAVRLFGFIAWSSDREAEGVNRVLAEQPDPWQRLPPHGLDRLLRWAIGMSSN